MWPAASLISSSPGSSQTLSLVFLCASRLFWARHSWCSFSVRRLLLLFFVSLWFCCGFLLLIFRYFWCFKRMSERWGWRRMCTVVDFGFCGVSTTSRSFSSDQLCSASRRTLRACTTPSSVLTGCSSVRSLLPSHTADFHLSASFGAGFPGPFPTSGR